MSADHDGNNRLLFIATLVYNGHAFRMYHQEKKARADNGTVEMNPQYSQAQSAPQPNTQQFPQYTDQQQYAAQTYPQQQAQPQYQPAYDTTYSGQQQYSQQPTEYQGSPQVSTTLGQY